MAEQSALAAYEMARKKKAVDKVDAKRNVAKQAEAAAKTNAAKRLNAKMRVELRDATAATDRKRAVGKQAAKDIERSRDLSQALGSFYKSDEYRAQDYAELEQAVREYRAHLPELNASRKVYT